MIENKLLPHTITIVTTHRCTSVCKSCCFDCSPHREKGLSAMEIKEAVDSVVSEFPDTIHNVVLTGGEVFLLGVKHIMDIIEHCKRRGLEVRIVTNGFWARNKTVTQKYISMLSSSGLDEINISTGDEHLKYVPIDNVLNIVECAEESVTIKSVVVVVEIGASKRFKMEDFSQSYRDRFAKNHPSKLIVLSSPWVDMTNKKITFQSNELSMKKDHHLINSGCDNLFTGIQINPSGQLLACCGFAAEYTPLLKMGDLRNVNKSIRSIWTEHLHDLLKIWLYTDGPKGIVEYMEGNQISLSNQLHDCEICTRLLLSTKYLRAIANLPEAKVMDILTRFHMKIMCDI